MVEQPVHERIGRYVAEGLGGPVQFAGIAPGASHDTLLFDVGSRARRVVVRQEPVSGPFLRYDVVREARLLERLADHGILVPRVLATCGDPSVSGARFVILEWVDGSVLTPKVAETFDVASRRQYARALARALAQIHSVDTRALEHLVSASRIPSPQRVLDAYTPTLESMDQTDTLVLDLARVWLTLRQAGLEPDTEVLVHGDFRLGNLVWRDTTLTACLDWETAHLGSRYFDLAWLCMGVLEETDLVMGLVPFSEFLELYREASSVDVDRRSLGWWRVATSWVRGCTEARLLDLAVRDQNTQVDPRDLLWEFGSHRTDRELLDLMDAYDAKYLA